MQITIWRNAKRKRYGALQVQNPPYATGLPECRLLCSATQKDMVRYRFRIKFTAIVALRFATKLTEGVARMQITIWRNTKRYGALQVQNKVHGHVALEFATKLTHGVARMQVTM
jgi:hypothetical protein